MSILFGNNIFETAMDQFVYMELLNTHIETKNKIKPNLLMAYRYRQNINRKLFTFDFNTTASSVNNELNIVKENQSNNIFSFNDSDQVDNSVIIEKYGISLGLLSSKVFDNVLKDTVSFSNISSDMEMLLNKLNTEQKNITNNVIKDMYDYEQYIQYSLLFQNIEKLKEIENTLLKNFNINRSLISSDYVYMPEHYNLNIQASTRFLNELNITPNGRVIIKNLLQQDDPDVNKKAGFIQRLLDKMYI